MQLKQKLKKTNLFFFFIFSLILAFVFTENKINQIQAEGLVEKYQCIQVAVKYGESIKNSKAQFSSEPDCKKQLVYILNNPGGQSPGVCGSTATCTNNNWQACGTGFECLYSCYTNDGKQCRLVRSSGTGGGGNGSCDNSSATAAVCRGLNEGVKLYQCNWQGSGKSLQCQRTFGTQCAAVEINDLACNGTIPIETNPPPNGTCVNTGRPFTGQCVKFTCNQCDQNGRCGEEAMSNREFGPCDQLNSQANECYQIDAVDDQKNYCILPNWTEIVHCPSSCMQNPVPVNPSSEPSDNPSPTQKLACGQYGCTRNADCDNGLTCQTVEVDGRNRKICAKGENQLFCAAAPSVKNCCESQPMPVCASIEMLNANNEVMQGNDDEALKLNDKVRFRCSASGNQDIEFDYQFRIWDAVTATWTDITDLTDTVAKNISALYTIKNFGKHIAQGRICWGNSCQPWESPETTPTQACQDDEDCPSGSTCYQPPMPACPSGTSCPQVMPAKYCKEETDNNTTARCQSNADCQNGYTCSSTPAGGCPLVTVNGVKVPSNCASAPICRQAEGISCTNTTDCFMGYSCQNRQCKRQAGACQSDADCQNGYTCYQPTTAEIANCSGANCAQVASYCKEKTVSCQSDADCKEGYLCSAEVSGSSGNASYTSISTNKICQKIEGMTCQNSSACGTGYACYSGHCTQTIKTCQNNDECGTGYACCTSSMPACPPGVSCPQVMPAKNCVLSKYCVNR